MNNVRSTIGAWIRPLFIFDLKDQYFISFSIHKEFLKLAVELNFMKSSDTICSITPVSTTLFMKKIFCEAQGFILRSGGRVA